MLTGLMVMVNCKIYNLNGMNSLKYKALKVIKYFNFWYGLGPFLGKLAIVMVALWYKTYYCQIDQVFVSLLLIMKTALKDLWNYQCKTTDNDPLWIDQAFLATGKCNCPNATLHAFHSYDPYPGSTWMRINHSI